jgi:hypothetical protein
MVGRVVETKVSRRLVRDDGQPAASHHAIDDAIHDQIYNQIHEQG